METADFQSRLHDLFGEAVDMAPPGRAAFLDRSCQGDARLRAAVDDLLSALDSAGQFLADPVVHKNQMPASEEPTRIGPYALIQIIGEGGHGTVYLAQQDPPLARIVALKVIRAGTDSAGTIARFELERTSLARMDHPNIARVFDAGSTDRGQPYFVMERVDGPSITDHCIAHKLDLRSRIQLMRDICAAVQHAHQKGIVHRDLKPTNVLVAVHDGRAVPKVIDFGIAIAIGGDLTQSTAPPLRMIGTPSYSSPEQLSLGPDDIDTRADVYGLGMILYELLTDTPAFDWTRLRAGTERELARTIREVDPPKPTARGVAPSAAKRERIRPALDRVVMKAIDKDRARRYPTVEALSGDLLRYLNDEPVEAGPSSAVDRAGSFVRRNRQLVAMAGVLILILLAGVAVALVGLVKAREERDRAIAAEHRTDEALRRVEAEKKDVESAQKLASDNAVQVFSAKQFLYLLITDPDRPISPSLLDTLAMRAGDPLMTDHPDVVSTLHLALGTAYMRAKLIDPGIEQYRLYLASIPPNPPRDELLNKLQVLQNLGRSLFSKGDDAGARPYLQQALDLFHQLQGKDDIGDCPILEFLGLATANLGDNPGGERLIRQALEICKAAERPNEHKEWPVMEELAQVLDSEGRHQEAKVLWDEAMKWETPKRTKPPRGSIVDVPAPPPSTQ